MAQPPKQLARINLKTIIQEPSPLIDLQIPIYESSARSFMRALTTHKRRVLTQHSERLEHSNAEIRKTAEKASSQEANIRKLKIQEGELKTQLKREEQERHDAEVIVLTLQRQLACLKDAISAVDAEYAYQAQHVEDLKKENASEMAVISSLCTADMELATLLGDKLGCMIQGVGNQDKRLMICFRKLDQEIPDREVFFVLDCSLTASGGPYRVLCSSPNLPSMALLVTALNDSHDVNAFIKACREAYRKLLGSE